MKNRKKAIEKRGNYEETVGEHAFNGCTKLKEVHISDIGAWAGITFGDVNATPLYSIISECRLLLNGNPVTDVVVPEAVYRKTK